MVGTSASREPKGLPLQRLDDIPNRLCVIVALRQFVAHVGVYAYALVLCTEVKITMQLLWHPQ